MNLVLGSTGEEICESVSISGYGSFACLIKAIEISAEDAVELKTASGAYPCGNLVESECAYEQLNDGSPTVTSMTVVSSTEIDIVGSMNPMIDIKTKHDDRAD